MSGFSLSFISCPYSLKSLKLWIKHFFFEADALKMNDKIKKMLFFLFRRFFYIFTAQFNCNTYEIHSSVFVFL